MTRGKQPVQERGDRRQLVLDAVSIGELQAGRVRERQPAQPPLRSPNRNSSRGSILRLAIAERPILLAYLNQADEDILTSHL